MENPATWGKAEKVIHEVLRDKINILPEFKAGLSTERRIADALRDHGLLKEDNEKEEDGGTAAEQADQGDRGEARAEVRDGTLV